MQGTGHGGHTLLKGNEGGCGPTEEKRRRLAANGKMTWQQKAGEKTPRPGHWGGHGRKANKKPVFKEKQRWSPCTKKTQGRSGNHRRREKKNGLLKKA